MGAMRIEKRRQAGDYRFGSLVDLSPGDPDHRESAQRELGVLAPIALEVTRAGVGRERVDLDDELPVGPEEIDLPAVEAGVDAGLGEPGSSD
jgi:hypothetical protein